MGQSTRRSYLVPSCHFILTLCLALILSGCGYSTGQGEGLPSRYRTISVPYIDGDNEGAFTAAVIKEIAQTGAFEFRDRGGRLDLFVRIIDLREDNIGFRYDRKKKGQLTKDIIPTEMRATLFVEVSVVDTASNCCVLGPVRLSASIDVDHDFYFSRDGVNVFSLGQLSDIDAAYDALEAPLYDKMAIKIADYVTQSW